MASMKYHKDVKRWRVFWHVTLPDGAVDKGSKLFNEIAETICYVFLEVLKK
jgi:hypothetical protein